MFDKKKKKERKKEKSWLYKIRIEKKKKKGKEKKKHLPKCKIWVSQDSITKCFICCCLECILHIEKCMHNSLFLSNKAWSHLNISAAQFISHWKTCFPLHSKLNSVSGVPTQYGTQQDYYGLQYGTLLHTYCHTGIYIEVVLLFWSISTVTLENQCTGMQVLRPVGTNLVWVRRVRINIYPWKWSERIVKLRGAHSPLAGSKAFNGF